MLALQQYLLLRRNLVYTSITRGKKLVVRLPMGHQLGRTATPSPRPPRPNTRPLMDAAAPVYAQPSPVYAYPAPSYGYYNSWPCYWGYPTLSIGIGFGGGYYGGYHGGGYYGGGYYGGGGYHGGGGGHH